MSVPEGSEVSACQTIVGSCPDASRSARAMSRSRLIPGKTRTADFIWCACLAQNLDPVILDYRVRQQLVGGGFQRRLGVGLVGAGQFDVEHLALAHTGHAIDAERFKRPFDGLALRIENAGFESDGDACFHVIASA